MTRRQLIAALLLAVVSGGLLWLRSAGDREVTGAPPADGHVPDYYLETFTLTAMTPSGRPDHRLDATRMEHFPDDETSELERPHMVFYRPAGPAWHVDAERGWVGPDGDTVRLLGRVDITRDGASGHTPMHIETRDLDVHLEREYAETDAAVTARSPNTVTHAVGMRAELSRSWLELRSQVKTVHEPQTR